MNGSNVVADSLQGSTAVYERHGADSMDGSNDVCEVCFVTSLSVCLQVSSLACCRTLAHMLTRSS